MIDFRQQIFNASRISVSLFKFSGSKFCRKVPSNKLDSYKIIVIFDLKINSKEIPELF